MIDAENRKVKKRILIISDSHRHSEYVKVAIDKSGPFDMLIHLGDIEEDPARIREWAGCPCYFVRGNCDYDNKLQMCHIINLPPHRIFAVHGHRYSIREDTLRLEYAAKEVGCDIALFGHTHVPYIFEAPDIKIVNPGSCALPRQYDRKKTYVVLEQDEAGDVKFTFCNLDRAE